MIDFRYHIVSIVAVFLALGLGVLVGTTVLDRVTVEALEGRVDDLRDRLNEHREEIRKLRSERDRANDLVADLGPEVTEGVLVGMRVVFVTGDQNADWHDRVRDAITGAGAENVGSIALTSKWLLESTEDRDDLIRAFGDRALAERDAAGDGAVQLGELLGDGDGSLLSSLSDEGFVRLNAQDASAAFPPSTVHVVVLSSPSKEPLAALARGSARVTSTLALAPDVENLGAIGSLRRLDDPPGRLATFDSAAADPGASVGMVLALRSAADGAGGHFGRGPGLRFLPPQP